MKSLKPTPIQIRKNFSGAARDLRKVFESKFADPRKTHANRFVWDYWHIENQYSALRTPARHYFPKPMFERIERELQKFGQRTLGCNGISDPWLSLYTDGCYQNVHSDSPHGPWAYVFSLTPWKGRRFRGGETLVARERLLDFWPHFSREERNKRGIEMPDLFEAIPAEFNQLTVFDPRLPHGVKEVRGTREPLEGRLVIHGWFVEPRPFLEGGLNKTKSLAAKTSIAIDEMLFPISEALAELSALRGTVAIRVKISNAGRTGAQELLAHSLVNTLAPSSQKLSLQALRIIAEGISIGRFPVAKQGSTITIPILFR